ncbi:MAG: glycosyltransferase [archaeon]|jgi:glycosyltransferase involved in cell wall biosynthesis
MNNKTIVILPAHNEQSDIVRMVGNLVELKQKGAIDDFVVVANGCTDRTAEIAKKLGANVIEIREANKGRAFIRGLRFAKKQGADIVVTLDADAERFGPANIRALVDPVKRGLVMMAVSEVTHSKFRVTYPAEYSGFRAISMDALKPILIGNKSWIQMITSTPYSLERGLNAKILGNIRLNEFTMAGAFATKENHRTFLLSGNKFFGGENANGVARDNSRQRAVIVEAGFKVNRHIRDCEQIIHMNAITEKQYMERLDMLRMRLRERQLGFKLGRKAIRGKK